MRALGGARPVGDGRNPQNAADVTAPDPRELAAIFAGGCVGGLARAGLAEAAGDGSSGAWPWPTFAVNVLGALLLGYFVTRLQERLPPTRYRRPFVATGVCGALTTFSTMQIELLRMLDHHHVGLFLGYAAASIAAGFVAVALATSVTRRVRLVA
ncbi:MAG: fluoride exporter [Thermoleophilaceae bacterium]|nr:fluoride exporter [Thermoleophilaceae bacterium]